VGGLICGNNTAASILFGVHTVVMSVESHNLFRMPQGSQTLVHCVMSFDLVPVDADLLDSHNIGLEFTNLSHKRSTLGLKGLMWEQTNVLAQDANGLAGFFFTKGIAIVLIIVNGCSATCECLLDLLDFSGGNLVLQLQWPSGLDPGGGEGEGFQLGLLGGNSG